MKITKAVVILSDIFGDKVSLYTDMPSPVLYPLRQTLTLEFYASPNTGCSYVRKHFNIEPFVLGSRKEEK